MTAESAARRLVYERSGRVCEVRLLDVCSGRATDWHHRKNRSQGGLWTPSNGLDLCHPCHMEITGTRAAFYACGWLVKSWQEPSETAVLIHTVHYGHTSVLLDDLGCYSLAPWPEHPEGHPDDLPVRGIR